MWIKLDDRFLLNPKVMNAGLHARALYVAGLCYASGELTDGFIPSVAVRRLGVLADVAEPERAAERLTEIGLWEVCDGGYQVRFTYCEIEPAENAIRRKESRQTARDVRRARKKNAPRVEPIRRKSIIQRDRSICYLCGRLLAEKEVTLDHVVALARGGDHTEANLRVACRPCNSRKGAR